MKILFITQFFSSSTGGGETLFYNVVKTLAERGHEALVVCHKMNYEYIDEFPNARIFQISPKIDNKGLLPRSICQNLQFTANAAISGVRIIRSNKVDLIHTNGHVPILAGSILGKLHRIPVIATIHDTWKTWPAEEHLGKLQVTSGYFLEKLVLKMPLDRIHAVSNTTKQDILEINDKAKITVIHNGIDPHAFPKGSECYFGKSVIFIGRLVYHKNLEVAIRAFQLVTKAIPEAKLIVIGDGPMKGRWVKLSSELGLINNITFTGYIEHDEKLAILNSCSTLVMPSIHEGFGLVILEAFAVGKPVLVSNVKPYDEIVQEGEDGYLISPYDYKEWASKIILLLSSPELCHIMGERGRKKAEKNFDINNVANKMDRLYREILKCH